MPADKNTGSEVLAKLVHCRNNVSNIFESRHDGVYKLRLIGIH